MKHDPIQCGPLRPLSLRLRRLRQLNLDAQLGQAQLAAQAGITARQLRALESTRMIPTTLRPWLALAAALKCSVPFGEANRR